MKRITLLLLAGLSASVAAHAADPIAHDPSRAGAQAGVTVAIDPATGRLRAPTAAEQAELAKAPRMVGADRMSIAKPGPKTRAEAERTMRRHPDGRVSMQVSDDMMSYITATRREDGTIVIGHGDAGGQVPPATPEAVRE